MDGDSRRAPSNYTVGAGFHARPAWEVRTTPDARYPTRSSVRYAPTVGGGVLDAPCAG